VFPVPTHLLRLQHETPDEHLTIFENLGIMVPDSAYIHIVVPVNITYFDEYFLRARTLLQETTERYQRTSHFDNRKYYNHFYDNHHTMVIAPRNDTPKADAAGFSIYHRLANLHVQFQNLTRLLPEESQSPKELHDALQDIRSRPKRGIFFVGALIVSALLGTFLGMYSQSQINTIRTIKDMDLLLHVDDHHNTLIHDLQQRVNNMYTTINNEAYPYVATQYQIWNEFANQVQYRLTQFKAFVTDLQDHRLSITWFNDEQLQEIHQRSHQTGKSASTFSSNLFPHRLFAA
jgi:hypothetical protein